MAGKESASYAPEQKIKDDRSATEKALAFGKWTNKITIPLGAAVTVGATVLGFPIVAAGALAGMGTDYMAGEYADEHRKKLEQKRQSRKEVVVFDAKNRKDYALAA